MSISAPATFAYTPLRSNPVGLAIAGAMLLVGGALSGFGIGCTVIDANDDAPPQYVAGDDIGMITVGGGVLAILGLVTWSILIDRFRLVAGELHAFGLFGVTAGPGLLAAARHLGVSGWYAGAGVLTFAAGALFLILAGARVTSRRRRWNHELDLIARGVPVSAVVIDSGLDPDDYEDASNVITTVIVGFTDATGIERRLHRAVTIPRSVDVVEGQRTVVWYDPDDPGNEKAMVVGLQHALRWNVPVPAVTPAG